MKYVVNIINYKLIIEAFNCQISLSKLVILAELECRCGIINLMLKLCL